MLNINICVVLAPRARGIKVKEALNKYGFVVPVLRQAQDKPAFSQAGTRLA